MTDRKWIGLAVAAVFFVGLAAGHWYPGARSRMTVATRDELSAKQTARTDERRTAEAVATADDTGTERVVREVRKPDGTVATTTTDRSFRWRRMQREEEHEEKRAEVQTVVQVVHDTKVVTEVRELPRPTLTVAALAGLDLNFHPVAALQLRRHLFWRINAVAQVQKTFAPGASPLSGVTVLGGLEAEIP